MDEMIEIGRKLLKIDRGAEYFVEIWRIKIRLNDLRLALGIGFCILITADISGEKYYFGKSVVATVALLVGMIASYNLNLEYDNPTKTPIWIQNFQFLFKVMAILSLVSISLFCLATVLSSINLLPKPSMFPPFF